MRKVNGGSPTQRLCVAINKLASFSTISEVNGMNEKSELADRYQDL